MFIASGAQRLMRLCTGVSLSRIGSGASHTTTPMLDRILRWEEVVCHAAPLLLILYSITGWSTRRGLEPWQNTVRASGCHVVCIAVSAN